MVSSVRSRPNHYELLGLAPSASAVEIAQAFASKLSLFGAHPVAEVAKLSVAYETLRDPARRRAYDDTLRPPPAPKMGYSARWSAVPLGTPVGDRFRSAVPQTEPHVIAEPKVEAPIDPRAVAIAASLRELARPVMPESLPAPSAQLEERPQPEPEAEANVEDALQHIREFGRAEKERLSEAKPRSVDWRRPALAVGGLILGAGLFGTLAGLSVKDNAAAAQTNAAITVPLPAAKSHSDVAAAEPEQAIAADVRADAPISRARRTASPKRSTKWVDQMAESLSTEGVESANEQATPDPQPAQVLAASLPLGDAAIARTIGRIGYSCGEVASTSPVEGAPGVFKVTCTSGHSYQATPVRGRYHFRRMGSR